MEKTLAQPEVMVHYDPETDVLDIFIVWGEPPSVIGEAYIGEGILVHYDERTGRITGVTIIDATKRRHVGPFQKLISREEVSVQLKDAFAPFPMLNRVFHEKWREERLKEVTVTYVDGEKLPLLLQWALLPTSPNPALKALDENLSLLRKAGVKGLDDKLNDLKTDHLFWSTLSELYLAAHFQRLGAKVTEFNPTTKERSKADFHFKVKVRGECWQGIVEVHTFYPPMQEEVSAKGKSPFKPLGQIQDPVRLAWKRLRKKVRQLPPSKPQLRQLHILAEAINLFPVEAQIPLFVNRSLFCFPEVGEVLKAARGKVDAIVLFAINPLFKLLFYIRWLWLPGSEDLAQAHHLFRDYPQKVPSNSMEIAEVVLDYLRNGLITVEEAAEILRVDPEKIAL